MTYYLKLRDSALTTTDNIFLPLDEVSDYVFGLFGDKGLAGQIEVCLGEEREFLWEVKGKRLGGSGLGGYLGKMFECEKICLSYVCECLFESWLCGGERLIKVLVGRIGGDKKEKIYLEGSERS